MQHDDHIWVTVRGEAWAIERILRYYPDVMVFHLRRGYEPNLEFSWFSVSDHNWEHHYEEAVILYSGRDPDLFEGVCRDCQAESDAEKPLTFKIAPELPEDFLYDES
jgi:hypothetical protein